MDLTECLIGIAADSAIRAIVIKGAGERAFVAGADIKEIAAYASCSASNDRAEAMRAFVEKRSPRFRGD